MTEVYLTDKSRDMIISAFRCKDDAYGLNDEERVVYYRLCRLRE